MTAFSSSEEVILAFIQRMHLSYAGNPSSVIALPAPRCSKQPTLKGKRFRRPFPHIPRSLAVAACSSFPMPE